MRPDRCGRTRLRGDPAGFVGGLSSVADRLLRSAAMLSGYAPILFFFGICAAFAVFAQLLNAVLGPKRPSPTKDLPYESGMVPRESARRRFSVELLRHRDAVHHLRRRIDLSLSVGHDRPGSSRSSACVEMGIFIATLLVGSALRLAQGGAAVGLSNELIVPGVPGAEHPARRRRCGNDRASAHRGRGADRAAERVCDHHARQGHPVGPVQLAVAGALRARLLRDRDDGHRRRAVRHVALRVRGRSARRRASPT